MISRVISIAWIAISLVVSVFAVTALFDAWEIADTGWKPEFYELGVLYGGFTRTLGDYVANPIKNWIGVELPCWWIHIFVIYAAAASAIWIGSMSRDEAQQRINEFKRGGLSIAWPLAGLGLLYQGFQNKYVTGFLKQNTGMGLMYAASIFGLYGLANWTNSVYLDSAMVPGQEVSLQNADRCPIDPRIKELILERGKDAVREEILGEDV